MIKKRKIILILDIDDTLFHYTKNGPIRWIGGESKFWMDLLTEVECIANKDNSKIILSVVTAKDFFDEYASLVARTFKDFLSKSNTNSFKIIENKDWCLINVKGRVVYEELWGIRQITDVSQELFSNFLVLKKGSMKSEAIRLLAQHYDVPLGCCVLIDDTPVVLREAEKNGINTISCECFNQPDRTKHHEFSTEETALHLDRIKHQILTCVSDLGVKSNNTIVDKHSKMAGLLFAVAKTEPTKDKIGLYQIFSGSHYM